MYVIQTPTKLTAPQMEAMAVALMDALGHGPWNTEDLELEDRFDTDPPTGLDGWYGTANPYWMVDIAEPPVISIHFVAK